MLLIPDDLLKTLEFDKIQELTAQACLGDPGRRIALGIKPTSDLRIITARLQEVAEWVASYQQDTSLPLSEYEDISPTFRFLEIVDYVLDTEDLLRYRTILLLQAHLHAWWTEERNVLLPTLYERIHSVPLLTGPLQALNRVFDESGQIRDDASTALRSIRAQIRRLEQELDKVFEILARDFKQKGWLTDSGESVRNGRRVLAVPAEHKRKIKGIIHDDSASGRTVFLEPEQMVELNNDLFELESDEKQEIYRIIKELCNQLRPYLKPISDWYRLLVKLDIIRAKARVSLSYSGHIPIITEQRQMKLLRAFHPLLWLKYSATGREVVPFDLELDTDRRLLILSGPNAGGKSVTMKSVVLIQLLAQSGYLVPAAAGTTLPIFRKFFADIGDQQSLEDDLSTYSSKLKNMEVFLRKADAYTLIAIDEMGSGTDPQMGGAIAEAILDSLHRKKVMGIVTTHYSNLKIFAFHQKAMVNGAMIFDREKLKPTYQLQVGKPGSSFAFEIATSSGIPQKVLDYAKKKAGASRQEVEQLLHDLQSERHLIEQQLITTKEREKKVDQLIAHYDNMFRELEFQRKKLKLEARELELQKKSAASLQVEQIIRELKEERNLEKTLAAREMLRQEQDKLRQQVIKVKEESEALAHPDQKRDGPLEVGDFVRIRGGESRGQIIQIDRKKASVNLGEMVVHVPLSNLEPVAEPLSIRSRKSVHLDHAHEASYGNKLDIRGFKLSEATRVVELFLDKALLGDQRSVHIIHGVGTGALRKAVMQKAREYNDIRAIEPAPPDAGGDGVTIIYFT